ncbi:mandelate racemase/muconate lactonizing enzyme family protein [Actinomadura roseirufa]|uniref:mandelate racemase/muconate lactonizing enzyme family protein n=1 Tax=Actinomadura roseirufa TaxID=2094049 RepID=UPI001040FB23|nr:mandelate racemase/muconate lactonizing enzyme family protein [Actinomadura roseirufa]
MKITRVRARAVAVPVGRLTQMATRTMRERHYVLVEVEAGGGSGVGYAYAGTSGGPLLVEAVKDLAGPVLEGAEAEDVQGLWELMYQESLLAGRRGAVLRAISAVDIALWDLRAKECGVPLAVLLGGSVRRPVPAYASGGYYRPDDGPYAQAVAREIEANRAAGFTDHKIKVGRLPVAEDAARVRAAAEVIGAEGRLALDANNAYRDAAEALRAARAFERAAGEAGLWWFEEPLSPDDIAGHAELARVLETPVATGEIHQTRHEFRALIEHRAADLLQPDAGVLGGVTEYLRVANAASTFGLQVAPHWHANLHAHLAAATPNTLAVEHFAADKDIYNFERLLTPETRLRAADGAVHLGDGPGLGIEFDEAAVASFVVD